ncbi:hypothetical protein Bhyg_06090 [Pseudolycoriella hygida]|uniref:Uncharacterized protein n=1 Tax=Pseudolycoriella hygida TaxID=35572 RepID=A0A9Q0S2H9_9DIPT|nr:hypothetical protein Bhyg_06090 [Pseudolycoriella hygida]
MNQLCNSDANQSHNKHGLASGAGAAEAAAKTAATKRVKTNQSHNKHGLASGAGAAEAAAKTAAIKREPVKLDLQN